jgi:hypothetical protein
MAAAAGARHSNDRKTDKGLVRERSRTCSLSVDEQIDKVSTSAEVDRNANQEVEWQFPTTSIKLQDLETRQPTHSVTARKASRTKVKTGCSNCK